MGDRRASESHRRACKLVDDATEAIESAQTPHGLSAPGLRAAARKLDQAAKLLEKSP